MESSDEEYVSGNFKCNLNSRFYRQMFPKISELVMVKVRMVDMVGAYVQLLEYNNIEGLIMLGELSKKRIRSVNRLTRVGRKEIAMVVRVDESKGYLDLSKKQVTAEDIKECEAKYKKAKSVHSILRHVSQTTGTDLEKLYETIGWPLYDKYDHALDAFKSAVEDANSVLEGLEMTAEIRESLLNVIKNRLTPTKTEIRADFSMTCYEYDGIDAIKAALTAGKSLETKDIQVKITFIASPLYVMILSTRNRAEGLELANASLKLIEKEIKARGGNILIKEAPHVLNDNDDHNLEGLINKQNHDNKGVSDIEENNEEGMGDVDIGIDIDEIDAKNAAARDEDDEEEEEEKH